MTMKTRVAVIMAGGAGTRFWPLSRQQNPKQFIPFLNGASLFQRTYQRLQSTALFDHIFVVTNENYRRHVLTQIENIDAAHVLVEPMRRDTAAAIAYTNHILSHRLGFVTCAFFAADHWIENEHAFAEDIDSGLICAEASSDIITIGIQPTYPATGYGYIECTDITTSKIDVRRFVEKPDVETAKTYLQVGNYLWNSGLFIATSRTLTAAFEQTSPIFNQAFSTLSNVPSTDQNVLRKCFEALPKKSFDYVVMEHYPHIKCIKASFGWDDVGTFSSYEKYIDEIDTNRVLGEQIVCEAAERNTVITNCEGLTALVGVKDLTIVRDGQDILVLGQGGESHLKKLSQKLPDEVC